MNARVNATHDFLSAASADKPLRADGDRTLSLRTADLEWQSLAAAGTHIKLLRAEPAAQRSVALMSMAPGTFTGLHMHTALTSTLFLSGKLVDYMGETSAGVLGINEPGATHDAYCPVESLFLVRNEGAVVPVEAPPEFRGKERLDGLTPLDLSLIGPPDTIVEIDARPWEPTAVEGVYRRDLYSSGPNRSIVMMRFEAGAKVPAHRHLQLLDAFVISGELADEYGSYRQGDYILVPPGTTRSLVSPNGCSFIAWSDGPISFLDGVVRDLFSRVVPWPRQNAGDVVRAHAVSVS